jgi:hypothetical protein
MITLESLVNPFGGKREIEQPDIVRKIETRTRKIEKVIDTYHELHRKIEEGKISGYWNERYNYISGSCTEILSPEEINRTIEYIYCNMEKNQIESEFTGLFISNLIQKSYESGHNDFHLKTYKPKINLLASFLTGKKEDYIRMSIEGTEVDLGTRSSWIKARINGRASAYCGLASYDAEFEIHGNTDKYCGEQSHFSKFTIYGLGGNGCGISCGNSTYRTPNQYTFRKMIESVLKGNGNIVQLLDSKGKVLETREP